MTWLIAIIFVGCSIPALGQGTFQNLDFEQAAPVSAGYPYQPWEVTAASALPFWSVSYGNVQQSAVAFNVLSVGSAQVDLYGPNNPVDDPGVIDGDYSVALQWGYGPGLVEESVSLSQDGTIPANAESLQFKAWTFLGAAPLSVSFAGDNLSLFVLSSGVSLSGQPYNVYGANIASFANMSGQLEFTAPVGGVAGVGGIELDDISFSPQVVIPEPNPLALAGIGSFLVTLYRRIAARRS
jgi:hypothetical protein